MPERVERAYPVTIDSDTGLYDRWTMGFRASEEVERAQRYGYPVSLLMVTFQGSEVRRAEEKVLQLAELLRRHVRSADVLARYSYDTLALVLPYTGEEGARQLAQRIIQLATVMQPPTGLLGGPVPVQAGLTTVPQGYRGNGHTLVEQLAAGLKQGAGLAPISIVKTATEPPSGDGKGDHGHPPRPD